MTYFSFQNVFSPVRQALLACLFAFLMFCFPGTATAQTGVRSIEDFMKLQANWEEFLKTDYLWTLEGRYFSVAGTSLSFPHCPMQFVGTQNMIGNRGTTGVIEVTGRIVKEDGKLIFKMESLTPRPKDLQRLRTMRLNIPGELPEDWYKVADWATARGRFYDDAELLDEARKINLSGIEIEYRQLKIGDQDALEKLIEKAKNKQIELRDLQTLIHESIRKRLDTVPETGPVRIEELEKILRFIESELIGTHDRFTVWPVEFAADYLASPLEVYQSVPAEQKLGLNRILYVETYASLHFEKAPQDGSQGFQIASEFKQQVPERTDLIDAAVSAGWDYVFSHLDTMTQTTLLQNCEQFETHGLAEQVPDLKRAWLRSREAVYQQDGTSGLIDLANLWIELLGDVETAKTIYIKAWELNHDSPVVTTWLDQHEMRLVDGKWLTLEEVAARPLSPIEQAIREGRLETGMTPVQVLSVMGSKPVRKSRLVTRQGVEECWVYESPGVRVFFRVTPLAQESLVYSVKSAN